MKITKKLRDVTKEEFKKWKNINCLIGGINCSECPFYKVSCGLEVKDSWIFNKDVYSDKFLDQTIEVEAPDILDKEEKEYLSYVIKPFRNEVTSIEKIASLLYNDEAFLQITTESKKRGKLRIVFPYFSKNTMYKGMKDNEPYKLEELGL